MDFMTVKDTSKLWDVSVRRIHKSCSDGRVNGAIKMAGVWLIPLNSQKPIDARIKSGKYIKNNHSN